MPHASSTPTARPAGVIRGLAFGSAAYAVAVGIRMAAVGNILLPLSILGGVGQYPISLFTGADARIGFGVLILALVCSLPFAPLLRGLLAIPVALFTFVASHFASVVIPYLFVNGVVPLPGVLRTPSGDPSQHPWFRVLLFSALLPLALSVSVLLAARLIRTRRHTQGPA